MKFVIDKKELSNLTNIVHRAAANKNAVPALCGMLIETDFEKGLTFTATDMEIGIIASTRQLQVIENGKILVNAQYFSNIIKVLPDTSLQMELNSSTNKLSVYYGRSSTHINTYQDYDYPDLPLQKMEDCLEIEQKTIREALRKTSFAASLNHFRQIFTGVLFDLTEEKILRFVASDTHRLALFKYKMPEDEKIEPFNFVVPLRTVNELMRLLENSEEKIKIALSKNNVIFYKENFTLLSRLLEGKYPTYEQVIPSSPVTEINIKTDLLCDTLERAKVMPSNDKFKIPNILLDIKENELSFMTHSEMIGEINDLIEEVSIKGEVGYQISFNTNYFFDIVKVLTGESEDIDMLISGSSSPVIVKEKNHDDYIYVLVPLRSN